MWVKDFDTNENVRMLTLPEIGLYLVCLNHAWVNDGLPENPDDIARALKLPAKDFLKHWVRVSRCFYANGLGRLVNRRQEYERDEVSKKSAKALESANARWKNNANASESHGIRNARAFDSVSDSDASVVYKESSLQPKPEKPAPGIVRQSFAGFWTRWCELTKRKQRESFACQAWISVVEFETEQAAMACLERYGASDEVQRGIVSNPDRWLYDQARDKFAGEWQAKNGNGTAERKPTKSERVTEIFLQNMADKARREKA
jgi:uncharacterized protein YdaU (DUF1376 family)